MSEIYLTKIERKTIFTKSLIFVLIVFIISDLTVTGPFYFNFVPWLYILGAIGSIKKIDSTLMSFISTFTVFAASLIMQGTIACVINTLIALTTVVMGIITGKFIYEFILEHRLVKYVRRSRKIMYIFLMLAMLVISWSMVAVNSGDIVTYLISKANFKKYMEVSYDVQDLNIVKTQYIRNVPGKYAYTAELEGQTVFFIPSTKTVFKDTGKSARLANMQNNMNNEIKVKVQEIQNKYLYLEGATIEFDLEYSKVAIIPDSIVMTIECSNTNMTTKDQESLYTDIASCVLELQTLKQANRVIITINDNTLQVSKDNIQNLTPEYIKGGFEIEEIS